MLRMFRSCRFSLVLAIIVLIFAASYQIVRAQGLDTEDLTGGLDAVALANTLAGAGVSISNVQYTGAEVAAGRFTGGSNIIGFGQGVILSTGSVSNVPGPNTRDDVSQANGTPGDADLDQLANFPTQDAAVLEFDFVPNKSELTFRYVFASDEYNEFVNTQFNDVFAFFINGINCATVGGEPVTINTINNGNPFGAGKRSNPQLYRNNDPDDPGATINTEMDGLTVVLTCTAQVNANATNHIKLAIADASDADYDSNVFLQSGSFTTEPGVPPTDPEEPREREVSEPAFVTVVQRPTPNLQTNRALADYGVSSYETLQVNDGIVEYEIEIVNQGPGAAKNAVITMPFDPAEQRVLDARFSQTSTFVSKVVTNSLEITTGSINANGGIITGTVRLLTRPTAPLGASLGERLTYTWSDGESGGSGRSNLTVLAVGETDNNQPTYPLGVTPTEGPVGATHVLGATIFVPFETVTVWYHTPDNRDIAVGSFGVDAEGRVGVQFTTTGLVPGNYFFVAYGNRSRLTGVGQFVVK